MNACWAAAALLFAAAGCGPVVEGPQFTRLPEEMVRLPQQAERPMVPGANRRLGFTCETFSRPFSSIVVDEYDAPLPADAAETSAAAMTAGLNQGLALRIGTELPWIATPPGPIEMDGRKGVTFSLHRRDQGGKVGRRMVVALVSYDDRSYAMLYDPGDDPGDEEAMRALLSSFVVANRKRWDAGGAVVVALAAAAVGALLWKVRKETRREG